MNKAAMCVLYLFLVDTCTHFSWICPQVELLGHRIILLYWELSGFQSNCITAFLPPVNDFPLPGQHIVLTVLIMLAVLMCVVVFHCDSHLITNEIQHFLISALAS